MLRAGGRSNSLGRAGEVVGTVLQDPRRLRELLDCVGDDDAWVRMRAVDSVEKICHADPGRLRPHVEELLTKWAGSGQASVQWHLAQVLRHVDLTPSQQERAVAWLVERVATTEVDWIVAAESLKTLVSFVEQGVVAAAEVAALAEVQRDHRSASVRRKAESLVTRLRGPAGGPQPSKR